MSAGSASERASFLLCQQISGGRGVAQLGARCTNKVELHTVVGKVTARQILQARVCVARRAAIHVQQRQCRREAIGQFFCGTTHVYQRQ